MKIGFLAKVLVVGKNSRDYKKNDGSNGTSYSVAIMQDGACANISCSEDVFKEVFPDLSTPVTLGGCYDDTYKRMVFDSVIPAVKSPATK